MWIRKIQRDQKKGVDSPVPTQVVSNEEFIPRPQNPRQKQLEQLIGEMGAANARKIGMDRRAFMASSMGLATCFLASNKIYGKAFDVDEAEAFEPAAVEEKWPRGECFVMDVQSHFTNGFALKFRHHESVKNIRFQLKTAVESYGFQHSITERCLGGETAR